MRLFHLFLCFLVTVRGWDWNSPCTNPSVSSLPFCNHNLAFQTRAQDLISRLTLQEKSSLMTTFTSPIDRLFVPPLDATECLRGTASAPLQNPFIKTTSFPQAVANAASFNRTLLHAIASATSTEARAKTNIGYAKGFSGPEFGNICWSPVVNICRDPRWGRCQETYGEDPYLTSEYATVYINGLQNGEDPKYLKTVSTCKHFDVHGGPENIPSSRFSFDSIVSRRDWVTTFQPAFQACAEAGVHSYMCSYNSINGIPACANFELLTGLSRDEWNFTGFVVGDCGAVGNVFAEHHFTNSYEEAVGVTKQAGTDWDCWGKSSWYLDAVTMGILSEDKLDLSLLRLLTAQMKLGLFDSPDLVTYKKLGESVIQSPDHIALALEAAQQNIVLLENRNNILPLKITTETKIAIIGPSANNSENLLGDYSPVPSYVVTPLQAFQKLISPQNLFFAEGCKDIYCKDDSLFSLAVQAAQKSHYAILFLGTNTDIESEGNDRSDIILPGLQESLVKSIVASKVPTIVVLINGAAVSSPWISENVDALLDAFFPGQEGGNAIANVIAGSYNPAGRLPYTVYKSIQQLPPMVDYSMASGPNLATNPEYLGRTYRYSKVIPLYPFGYGLSYTKFQYSRLIVSQTSISPCQSVDVSVDVENLGGIAGSEVVELYLKHNNSVVPVPQIELAGFERIFLEANQKLSVRFTISPKQMAVVREIDFKWVIMPLEAFEVFVGGCQPNQVLCSSNLVSGGFIVRGNVVVPLDQCKQNVKQT